MRKLWFIAALAIGWAVLPASPAQGTFPDQNGRIAFRRFLNTDQTWGAIFTIRPDGTGERQITFPPQGFVDRNPDFSPDGLRIAFEREGVDCGAGCSYDEIFVVYADGRHLRQLTNNPPGQQCGTGGYCNGSPAWSPDGKRIAFRRAFGPIENDLIQRQGIAIMEADGSAIELVTQMSDPAQGEDTDPQWSPDGRRLVFQRVNVRDARPVDGVALWILNLNTGHERRITPWNLRAGDTPDWSPNGQRILFHSNLNGPSEVSANLYTIQADGTHLKQLTFEEGGARNYLGSSYSPDGTMITVGRRPATSGAADVFVMRVDGTHIRHVTRTVLYDSYPDWGPAF